MLGILLMSQAGLFRLAKVKAKLLDYVMLDYFRLEDAKMNPKVLPQCQGFSLRTAKLYNCL